MPFVASFHPLRRQLTPFPSLGMPNIVLQLIEVAVILPGYSRQFLHPCAENFPNNVCMVPSTRPNSSPVKNDSQPTVSCQAQTPGLCKYQTACPKLGPGAKPFPVTASTVRRKPLLGTKLPSAYAAQDGQLYSEVGGCCEQL